MFESQLDPDFFQVLAGNYLALLFKYVFHVHGHCSDTITPLG